MNRQTYIVQRVRDDSGEAGTLIYASDPFGPCNAGPSAFEVVAFLNGKGSPLPAKVAARYLDLPDIDVTDEQLIAYQYEHGPNLPADDKED